MPNNVAYIGGSITKRPVIGYHKQHLGDEMWPDYDIGKGTMARWNAPGSEYWGRFDAMLRQYPNVDRVWAMLCTHDKDYGNNIGVLREQAHQYISDLSRRLPGVPIFSTPMFVYLDYSCPAVKAAIQDTATVLNELVGEGLVTRGPVLRGLKKPDLANGRCDQNVLGRNKHALDLDAYLRQT